MSSQSYPGKTTHIPLKFEKNQEIPSSLQDEALLFLQSLESNPEPLSKLHRRLDSLRPLNVFQEIPMATREDSRVFCFNSR